eukprot:1159476-Pelagomonas_calceolata.AAC.3
MRSCLSLLSTSCTSVGMSLLSTSDIECSAGGAILGCVSEAEAFSEGLQSRRLGAPDYKRMDDDAQIMIKTTWQLEPCVLTFSYLPGHGSRGKFGHMA